MTLNVVHEQPVVRYFRAPTCSSAFFVKLLFGWLEIILPLFIIFATRGLWKKTGEFSETPRVAFEGKYMAICQSGNDYLFASSFPVLNSGDASKFVLSETSHIWKDYEKYRELELNLKVPIGNMTMDTLTYMIFFNYQLDYHNIIEADLAIIETVQFTSRPESLSVYGRLKARQAHPFTKDEKIILLDTTRRDVDYYKPQEIMRRSAAMDISLGIDTKSSYSLSSGPKSDFFSLSLTLIISEDQFKYSTDFWELLKWAWIQYLAVYVIIKYLSNGILDNLYENRLLEATPSHDLRLYPQEANYCK